MPNLTVQETNGIRYISGGVGTGEVNALKNMAHGFNVRVVSAFASGHYSGPLELAIEDADGNAVLNLTTQGPLFYAKLPAGKYKITARFEEQEKTVPIHISSGGMKQIRFTWPGSPKM